MSESKLSQLFELFKNSFVSFIETPLQKERLDPLQLIQMVAIVLFHLSDTDSNSNETVALDLLLFLIERLIYLGETRRNDELILAPLNIGIAFLAHFKSGRLIAENALLFKSSSNVEKYVRGFVKLLNELVVESEQVENEEFCALDEDRLLESYLPMKEAHKEMNFKKRVSGLNCFILEYY